VYFISALNGTGVKEVLERLYELVKETHEEENKAEVSEKEFTLDRTKEIIIEKVERAYIQGKQS